MKTYKLQIQRTETDEREISLPYYAKNNCHAFKIFSETQCVWVTHSNHLAPGIVIGHAGLAFQSSETAECTQEEFEELFAATSRRITELAVGEGETISK